MELEMRKRGPLRGELTVPADKSLSHRAVILGALARGESLVRNLSNGEDVQSTVRCMRQFGVEIRQDQGVTRILGKGLAGLAEPVDVVNCGNSGTTMRLLSGIAASRPFLTVLSGDHSLRQRPMARVIEPLQMMGATIYGRNDSRFAPLVIRGGGLHGIEYHLTVASAQVKSAILLAALEAQGETLIYERLPSRDHTERMMSQMGVGVGLHKDLIRVQGPCALSPAEWFIPGDISSAAFWMAAATVVTGSEILVQDVGVNPTRAGVLEVLQRMGAEIHVQDLRVVGGEPLANIVVRHSYLRPVELGGAIIPSLIDEIPVLAMAMAMAVGTSVVRDAAELRAKESDRIAMIVSSLSRMGVNAKESDDGFVVHGAGRIPGNSQVSSGGDHRMAMSLAIAGLVADMPVTVEGFDCTAISYPAFLEDLNHLTR